MAERSSTGLPACPSFKDGLPGLPGTRDGNAVGDIWTVNNLHRLARRACDQKRDIDASSKPPGVCRCCRRLPRPYRARVFDVNAMPIPMPAAFPYAAVWRDVGRSASSGDTVVAYDPAAGPRPRAWWMFLSFGHPMKVLDGLKMVAEGRPTHSGKSRRSRRSGQARPAPRQPQLVANLEPGRQVTRRGRVSGKVPRCGPAAAPASRQPNVLLSIVDASPFDEAAGGIAHVRGGGVDLTTDRDELRLRRQRRRADACALSSRRREPGAV
jgi:hypothetical protein